MFTVSPIAVKWRLRGTDVAYERGPGVDPDAKTRPIGLSGSGFVDDGGSVLPQVRPPHPALVIAELHEALHARGSGIAEKVRAGSNLDLRERNRSELGPYAASACAA
jgi:hypothetical protein